MQDRRNQVSAAAAVLTGKHRLKQPLSILPQRRSEEVLIPAARAGHCLDAPARPNGLSFRLVSDSQTEHANFLFHTVLLSPVSAPGASFVRPFLREQGF